MKHIYSKKIFLVFLFSIFLYQSSFSNDFLFKEVLLENIDEVEDLNNLESFSNISNINRKFIDRLNLNEILLDQLKISQNKNKLNSNIPASKSNEYIVVFENEGLFHKYSSLNKQKEELIDELNNEAEISFINTQRTFLYSDKNLNKSSKVDIFNNLNQLNESFSLEFSKIKEDFFSNHNLNKFILENFSFNNINDNNNINNINDNKNNNINNNIDEKVFGIKSSNIINNNQNTKIEIKKEFKNLFSGFLISIEDETILNEIKDLPGVTGVFPNNYFYKEVSNNTRNLLNITQIWNMRDSFNLSNNLTGVGVSVAVIDTGFDITHPDFVDCNDFLNCSRIIDSYDFPLGTSFPFDIDGHGTHVVSTLASNNENLDFRGIAPDVDLLLYNVFSINIFGQVSATTANVLGAMERAVDPNLNGSFINRADIVSMSLGSFFGDSNDLVSLKVDELSELGVLFVVAGGNSGPFIFSIGSPGSSRSALTVGAVFKDTEYYNSILGEVDDVAPFSSVGPTNIGLIKPDVIAPGVNICAGRADGFLDGFPSCGGSNEHVLLSGTSMATPIVSGVTALIKQKHPNWTNKEIKASLRATAIDVNESVFYQGWGRISPLDVINLEHPACVVEFDTSNLTSSSTDLNIVKTEENLLVNAFINCNNFSFFQLNLTQVNSFGERINTFEVLNSTSLNISDLSNVSLPINLLNYGVQYSAILELNVYDFNQSYNNHDMLYIEFDYDEVFPVNDCMNLDLEGARYFINDSIIFNTSSCFNVSSNNIFLDCENNNISTTNNLGHFFNITGNSFEISNCNFNGGNTVFNIENSSFNYFSDLSFFNLSKAFWINSSEENFFINLNFNQIINSIIFLNSSTNFVFESNFFNLSNIEKNLISFDNFSLNNLFGLNYFNNSSQFEFENRNNALFDFDFFLISYGNYWNISCLDFLFYEGYTVCNQPRNLTLNTDLNITTNNVWVDINNVSIDFINNSMLDLGNISSLSSYFNLSFFYNYETFYNNVSLPLEDFSLFYLFLNLENLTQNESFIDLSSFDNYNILDLTGVLNNNSIQENLAINLNQKNLSFLISYYDFLLNMRTYSLVEVPINFNLISENLSSQILGNLSNVVSNLNNLTLHINSSDNLSKLFNTSVNLSFKEDNLTIFEFEQNLNQTILDLRKIIILKQKNQENLTQILIDGVNLSQNKTKTIFFDLENLSSPNTAFCISDNKYFNFIQVNTLCLEENQTYIPTYNYSSENYNVTLIENTSIVKFSGLRNTVITQMCSEDWTFDSSIWSSCINSSQQREAIDNNSCGTNFTKPVNETRSCTFSPPPSGGGSGGGGGGGSSSSSSSVSSRSTPSQEEPQNDDNIQIQNTFSNQSDEVDDSLNINEFSEEKILSFLIEKLNINEFNNFNNLEYDEYNSNNNNNNLTSLNQINIADLSSNNYLIKIIELNSNEDYLIGNLSKDSFFNIIFNVSLDNKTGLPLFENNISLFYGFENFSYLFLNGLEKPIKKEIRLKAVLNSNQLCIKNDNVNDLSDFSLNCNSTNEILINCNSINEKIDDVSCFYENGFYNIYGLLNTGILEVDFNEDLSSEENFSTDGNFLNSFLFYVFIFLIISSLILILIYFIFKSNGKKDLENKSVKYEEASLSNLSSNSQFKSENDEQQKLLENEVRRYILKYIDFYTKESIITALFKEGINQDLSNKIFEEILNNKEK